jgi:hypothetical protein
LVNAAAIAAGSPRRVYQLDPAWKIDDWWVVTASAGIGDDRWVHEPGYVRFDGDGITIEASDEHMFIFTPAITIHLTAEGEMGVAAQDSRTRRMMEALESCAGALFRRYKFSGGQQW